ncbi:YchF/TatD family DNA exonuclease [Alteromonas sediminis]|uniref:YchF/TatD family DNA exonuclease n=1 Tax=Alteromonas sediminis TaxID=2259342 RepID=A0A3N5Y8E2_9ALTE|nr:YchF/TatD family DNA exonuclease [Alteromonas sediminis]RPJ67309.1 YchF/TatD family DNA exonuclease [Alteromonas sediminis]
MFVDSHCHLDRLDPNSGSVDEALKFAQSRGVKHFLCVAVSVKEFDAMMDVVSAYDNVSVSCGVHPLHQEDACSRQVLLEKASDQRVVAIGETGLDYYYSEESKAVQMTSFIDHIHVANELKKPLIIHTRGAKEDTLGLLEAHLADHTQGVLHCFTEDWDMAEKAMEMGMYISISGIVTFRTADALRDVAKRVPLDKLLIETDSPWLAPVPHRGKPNQPAYVVEVAEYIANLRGISVNELAEATTDNFYRLFALCNKTS